MKKSRHDARLNLRCSAETKAFIEANAAELGISVTEFIERSIKSTSIVRYDGLQELVPVMRRHGSNLNQIARYLNAGGRINQEIAEILTEYRETLDLLYSLAAEQRGE